MKIKNKIIIIVFLPILIVAGLLSTLPGHLPQIAVVKRDIASVKYSEFERLEYLLQLDRFLYYKSKFVEQFSDKLSKEIIGDIEAIGLQDLLDLEIDIEFLAKAQNYDGILFQILKEKGSLAKEEEISWGYNFLKNKLNDAFVVKWIDEKEGDFSVGPTARQNYLNIEVPAISKDGATMDVSQYISDRTTRAVFWESSEVGRPIEFHLGNERVFRKHLAVTGGKVLGEIKTVARNYNKIYLVQYADDDTAHLAITRVNGLDRLEHLLYEINLENNGQQMAKQVRVFGDLKEYLTVEEKRLTETLKQLPLADQVFIGQKRYFTNYFMAAEQFCALQEYFNKHPNSLAQVPEKQRKQLIKLLAANKVGEEIDFLKQASFLSDLFDKYEKELSLIAGLEQFSLESNAFDVSDMLIKSESGKVYRWRFVSNMWGDEVVPLARALKNSGHKNINYIGTAGALPNKGLDVGDIVIPKHACDDVSCVPILGKPVTPKNVKSGQGVIKVSSPFLENYSWVEKASSKADEVEIETKYLADIFSEKEDNLKVYLLVSDVLGSHQTLDNASSSARSKAISNLLMAIMEGEKIGFPDVINQGPSSSAGLEKMSKKVDPLYAYVTEQKVGKNSTAKGPVFTTEFFENRINLAQETLYRINQKIIQEVGFINFAINKDFVDGKWNPKTDNLEVYYPTEDSKVIAAIEKILAQETASLQKAEKTLLVHGARAPPDDSFYHFSFTKTPPLDFLLEMFSRNAYLKSGLYQETTATGKIKFKFLPTDKHSTLCSGDFCSLAFFAPDEATKKFLTVAKKITPEEGRAAINGLTAGVNPRPRNRNVLREVEIVKNLPNGNLAEIV
ncbi:MAG TPA: hypothetical protein VI754_04560, partial [Bacteriovoracaceae bacterium]|nr:hypothetical protein [Bacteriovoracaceae bacterium]